MKLNSKIDYTLNIVLYDLLIFVQPIQSFASVGSVAYD